MKLDTELEGLPVAEAAFYIRLALQVEVLERADISDWLDEVLLRDEPADTFFLHLYRVLHTNKQEVPRFLKNAFPDVYFTVRPGIGWLYRQFATGTWPVSQLVRSLYRLRTLVESDAEVGWIYGLAADYERAAGGSLEEMQEVEHEAGAFLACYQDYTFSNRAQWQSLDAMLEQRLAGLRF
ncbi:hypothetical protein MTX78_13560 [Hymenobacter tibetensis]|uniref:DUF4375 domain-containing protein n=1 Tax=Hymenobacter tibetensis TaxID=497967 RepID=A0ABY4CVY4_9BACT|nr:hypothetical protein [Hymenobacter tibetensis]UOG73151.1 hypothetical protein MTX78_13560 [Hymenobacter tibetensis]